LRPEERSTRADRSEGSRPPAAREMLLVFPRAVRMACGKKRVLAELWTVIIREILEKESALSLPLKKRDYLRSSRKRKGASCSSRKTKDRCRKGGNRTRLPEERGSTTLFSHFQKRVHPVRGCERGKKKKNGCQEEPDGNRGEELARRPGCREKKTVGCSLSMRKGPIRKKNNGAAVCRR